MYVTIYSGHMPDKKSVKRLVKRNKRAGSVTSLIDRLAQGDRSAIDPLWKRFWGRLTKRGQQLVHQNELRHGDEEDIAQVVFLDVMQRIADRKVKSVESRKHLWRLMELAAYHRAVDLFRQETADKRTQDLTDPPTYQEAKDPPPGFFVSLEDDLESISSRVDGRSKTIVMMIYHGHSLAEVAERLQITPRTVQRKLALIRDAWIEMNQQDRPFVRGTDGSKND